jgi:hypothetical protein
LLDFVAGWFRSADHRQGYGNCKSQIGETGLAWDHSVSTAHCEAIHMQATGRALTTAHENAAVGILVVQARCLGTLPRKVPEAVAEMTRITAKRAPLLHENRSNIFTEGAPADAGGRIDRARPVVPWHGCGLARLDG